MRPGPCWQDSATAYATFDLTGQAPGAYDVWAIQSDGTSTKLARQSTSAAAVPNTRAARADCAAGGAGRPAGHHHDHLHQPRQHRPAGAADPAHGQKRLFQAPGQSDYDRSTLQLFGFNPSGPVRHAAAGLRGQHHAVVQAGPSASGCRVTSRSTRCTIPAEPFDWNAFAANDVPANTSPQQWAGMVTRPPLLMGSTWGSVVSFLRNDSVQLLEHAGPGPRRRLNSLYNFDALLQYAVGVYGAGSSSGSTPSYPSLGSKGEVTVYNAHQDGSGNPIAPNPAYPTFVLVPGLNGYRSDFGALAQAIAGDTHAFPGGHVNILLATWQGATSGTTIDGVAVPWLAALHVDTAGADWAICSTTLQPAEPDCHHQHERDRRRSRRRCRQCRRGAHRGRAASGDRAQPGQRLGRL